MKRIFQNINMRFLPGVVLMATTLLSCSKWDDYKKYTAGGEIVYSGKLDSLKTFSGKNRVRITGILNADPKIAMVKIFWNQNKDSLSYEVKRSVTGSVFDQTFSMSEGVTTFTIYTYDVDGNKSVPTYVVGKSFGENYRKKINNRTISNIRYMSNSTTINWEPIDALTGAYSTEVQYVINGETKTVETPASENTVIEALSNTSTLIKFRAIYKPDATSIDTFMVAYKDTVVLPLKNARVPFIASARSGRWGNLAEWNSNDAVKNHGGFGGWDEWNSNIFNVESGWGSPAVTNGKIWQTFTLDPGTYTFEISDLKDTNLSDQDKAYLVANIGSDLPDVELVETTALGFAKIVKGKPLSDLRVRFTVTQTSEVSIGYLTTQPDGNPGRFCNIRAFNFYVSN